ncbi:MAG TPA: FAD binding domain-containing protein [Candidatus Sulfotelmatobacter sp.]|nr:FAD binding domain-containing protein [Candidatus Sulfotelmatobacter sp.]
MKPFTYERAATPAAAAATAAGTPNAKFIAGGTNLLDLMKLQVETPAHLIDLTRLDLDRIDDTPDGGIRVGALVTNTALAANGRVRREYGVLSRAIVAGASGQLRNKATTGGNLLQRTRCPYFRYQSAVQQAPARHGLRGDRRREPPAGRHRRQRRLHRHAPE